MKKVFYLIICVAILCCACANSKADIHKGNENSVNFGTGTYFLKFWNMDEYNTYDYSVIPNELIAVEVASTIFEGIPKSKQQYTVQEVFFDEDDEVWIVTFSNNISTAVPANTGNCCSIAMQKKDGKVLSVWFGE